MPEVHHTALQVYGMFMHYRQEFSFERNSHCGVLWNQVQNERRELFIIHTKAKRYIHGIGEECNIVLYSGQ